MRPKDEQKRQAIVHATLELVERYGLAGMTMSALAKQAGVATGTLYTYYASKEELLVSIHRELRLEAAERMRRGWTEADNFPTRLQRIVGNYAVYIRQRRNAFTFLDLMKRSPYLTDSLRHEHYAYYDFLRELITNGQALGFLRPAPPEQLLYFMDGATRSLVDWAIQHNDISDEDLAQLTGQTVWRGIAS